MTEPMEVDNPFGEPMEVDGQMWMSEYDLAVLGARWNEWTQGLQGHVVLSVFYVLCSVLYVCVCVVLCVNCFIYFVNCFIDFEEDEWCIDLDTNGITINYKIDSDAQANIIPIGEFKKLKKIAKLRAKCRLSAFNGPNISF